MSSHARHLWDANARRDRAQVSIEPAKAGDASRISCPDSRRRWALTHAMTIRTEGDRKPRPASGRHGQSFANGRSCIPVGVTFLPRGRSRAATAAFCAVNQLPYRILNDSLRSVRAVWRANCLWRDQRNWGYLSRWKTIRLVVGSAVCFLSGHGGGGLPEEEAAAR